MTDYDRIRTAIHEGRNIFLTGPGGVGKSHYVQALKRDLGDRISLTSTTGVSSFNLGAQTIHSYSGLGAIKRSDTADSLLKKVKKNRPAYERMTRCDILVIDEISMLGRHYLECLDKVAKAVRSSQQPFGGIQLLLTGDFLQLPPVNDSFCFNSDVWDALSLVTIYLQKMFRVADPVYTGLLERVRCARHTPEDNRILFQRLRAYKEKMEDEKKDEVEIEPTYLYSKKVNVAEKNMEELEQNRNELLIFRAAFVPGKMNKAETLSDSLDAIQLLHLKVGAQVMLTVNLDVDAGLVNGSRGVLVRYEPGVLYVRFRDGATIPIGRHEFVVEEDGKVQYKIVQFPLILAYALSIHKVQGSTLDYAVINLGHSVFEQSMSYVALSRVRSLDGLFLEAYQPSRIQCNEEALAFYDRLGGQADKNE